MEAPRALTRTGLVLALVLLGAAPGRAQSPLDRLKTVDEALLGEQRLGLYLGSKNIGQLVLQVERGTLEGEAYVTSLTMTNTFGGGRKARHETAALDARLARLAGSMRERDGDALVRDERYFLEPDGWRAVAHGKLPGRRFAAKAPDHGAIPSLLLLARALRAAPAGELTLTRVDWEPSAPRASAIEVTLPAGTVQRAHRGSTVEVREVTIEVEGAETLKVAVSPADGRLVAIELPEEGLTMLSGTPAEVAADLPARPRPAGAARAPLDAVRTFLEVIARKQGWERLDAVVDWAAVGAELARQDAALAGLPPDAVAAIMTQMFRASPGADDEELASLVAGLKLEPEGEDAARVLLQEGVFRLRREAGAWWITDFPR